MKERTIPCALGSSDHEIKRLDRQSASIEGATRLLLRASGIQPSMRAAERPQLNFLEGDVRTGHDKEPFDAIVGRLILFPMAEPVNVLRHQH